MELKFSADVLRSREEGKHHNHGVSGTAPNMILASKMENRENTGNHHRSSPRILLDREDLTSPTRGDGLEYLSRQDVSHRPLQSRSGSGEQSTPELIALSYQVEAPAKGLELSACKFDDCCDQLNGDPVDSAIL